MKVQHEGFAPGKVILLGEHGVVYGYPALAGALSVGVYAHGIPARRCQLEISPEIKGPGRAQLRRAFERAVVAAGRPAVAVKLVSRRPVSMGLGSSAAVAVACARMLLSASGGRCTPAEVTRVALEMEREFHGTPSGIDHTCSMLGQLIRYTRRPGAEVGKVQVVKSPRPLKVLVALAGKRSPTKRTVAALRDRRERWPARYRRLFAEIGRLVQEGVKAIEAGDLEALGDAMSVNQGLLSALQLSSPNLDEMVHRLRRLGALGAKLTGAGGDGGAVVGLFHEPESAKAQLSRAGIRCFSSQIAGPGTP